MSKIEPTEIIKSIKKGNEDSAGNKILHVLATGNEYAIYEIDTQDINYKLRIVIDGYTDESEQKIAERFRRVKQKYIKAKGLLYRSQNFGMMKNRVAHALSSALLSDSENPNQEFDDLIKELEDETIAAVWNRTVYMIPAFLTTMVTFFWLVFASPNPQAVVLVFGASLGGTLSILVTISKKHFEEYRWYHYLMLGIERIFLANVAAAIAFILINAGLVLPALSKSDVWVTLSITIVAGFSEQLTPSLVNKIAQNK
jgi:hypothetical protein